MAICLYCKKDIKDCVNNACLNKSELSKDTHLRIFNDAVKYGLTINNPAADHYFQGAQKEASRAQLLEEALEKIDEVVLAYRKLDGDNPAANHCRNIAMEALHKYRNSLK